jgi:hypothetical protein
MRNTAPAGGAQAFSLVARIREADMMRRWIT